VKCKPLTSERDVDYRGRIRSHQISYAVRMREADRMAFGRQWTLQLADTRSIEYRGRARDCVTKVEGCNASPPLSRNATTWQGSLLVAAIEISGSLPRVCYSDSGVTHGRPQTRGPKVPSCSYGRKYGTRVRMAQNGALVGTPNRIMHR
jgi:hypothetical protein